MWNPWSPNRRVPLLCHFVVPVLAILERCVVLIRDVVVDVSFRELSDQMNECFVSCFNGVEGGFGCGACIL